MSQLPNDPHITYQLQYRKCGKSSCRTCRSGLGHGPYWYAYWREGLRLRSSYVGKVLPEEAAKAAKVAQRSEELLLPNVPVEIPTPVMPQVREVARPRRVEARPKTGSAVEEPAAFLI